MFILLGGSRFSILYDLSIPSFFDEIRAWAENRQITTANTTRNGTERVCQPDNRRLKHEPEHLSPRHLFPEQRQHVGSHALAFLYVGEAGEDELVYA